MSTVSFAARASRAAVAHIRDSLRQETAGGEDPDPAIEVAAIIALVERLAGTAISVFAPHGDPQVVASELRGALARGIAAGRAEA